MIGEVLDGKYRIVRPIGEGGMGAVYEAEDVTSGRRVAAKVLHAHRQVHRDVVRRFEREVRAGMALPSRHIAQVLDAGADPETGAPYMVMEHLVGEDLEHLLQRLGPLPPTTALRIVGQVCAGLHQAHAAGVIHRDIKPANLFLARGDGGEIVVKILDFGVAKIRIENAVNAETTGLTRAGSVLGSPRYMSPEQARGIKNIDHRTDIWSLGVVLYRALTGTTPHRSAEGFGDLIMAICHEAPEPVQDLAPWVPPDIAALPHAAMRIRASDRFQTAAAMLESILSRMPDGLDLREDMMTPLTDEDRCVVAVRLDATTLEVPASSLAPELHAAPPPPGDILPPAATPTDAASTAGPVVHGPPAGAGFRMPALVAAALSLAAVAFGAHLVRTRAASAPAPSAALRPPGLPSGAEARSPAERRARVRITPPDARVEVNGKAAEVRGGVIELHGALGTTHEVRVTKGRVQTVATVAISEGGAMPGELALAEPEEAATAADLHGADAGSTGDAGPR